LPVHAAAPAAMVHLLEVTLATQRLPAAQPPPTRSAAQKVRVSVQPAGATFGVPCGVQLVKVLSSKRYKCVSAGMGLQLLLNKLKNLLESY
jgi:hypothetical protein